MSQRHTVLFKSTLLCLDWQVRMWGINGRSIIMSQRALKTGPSAQEPANSRLECLDEVLEVLEGNIGAVVEVCIQPHH